MNTAGFKRIIRTLSLDELLDSLDQRFSEGSILLFMNFRKADLMFYSRSNAEAALKNGGSVSIFDNKGEWRCEQDKNAFCVCAMEETGDGEKAYIRDSRYMMRNTFSNKLQGVKKLCRREYFRADEGGMLKCIASRFNRQDEQGENNG